MALSILADGSSGRGYVLKEDVTAAEHLVGAIRNVAAGGSFIGTDVLDALIAGRNAGPGRELSTLTSRELEVLAEVANGHNNRRVAESLGIGERAVEKHISSVFAKLGLTSTTAKHKRVAAVLIWLEESRGQDW